MIDEIDLIKRLKIKKIEAQLDADRYKKRRDLGQSKANEYKVSAYQEVIDKIVRVI